MTVEKWRSLWANKVTPMHRFDTEEHYQSYAAELRVLYSNMDIKSVLEIGCGDGSLYKYLGFDQTCYKGVDFSSSMLSVFREKYPDVELSCADVSVHCDHRKYDLIFSNQVIQYFDSSMVRRLFANAKDMMEPASLFICASIPWKLLRFKYLIGRMVPNQRKSIMKGCLKYVRNIYHDPIGKWYSLNDFKKYAAEYGMTVEFYGSMHYMYRFHAVMKLL
jgi:trans-aconitate methyltransferase